MLMVRAARSATSVRSHDIVGRAEQRAQLGRILDEVIDDGSRFVIMGGDAGPARPRSSRRSSPICLVRLPTARPR